MLRFPEDLAWARALARGEEAAWRRFLAEAGPVILAALKRGVGGAGEADREQALQELCLRLCEDRGRRLGTYRGESRLVAWAAAVAVRLGRELEARRRGPGAPAPSPEPVQEPDLAFMDREELERALASLTVREQLALRLVYWDGASLAEAAGLLGLPANSLSPLLSRAKGRLRNLLSGKAP